MAIFSLNSTVIARAAGGLYGLKIGTSTMNEALAAANASGVDALFNALYARDFGTAKVADVAKSIVTNVGITGAGVDAAVNYVTGQLTASTNKGATVVAILNAFSTLADATYGAAATKFNAQIAAAVTYAQTAGNQDAAFDALSINTGAAFNLTNIADVATAAVFNANQVYVPGGTNLINSLQNDDVLTGAGTADVLNAVLGNPNDNGVAEISPDLKGIETLNLRFDATSTSMVLDMQDSVGAVNVNISRIADGKSATVKNITEAAANKLSINNTNSPATGTVTFTYTDAATTPAAQAVDLTLNNARTSGVVLQSATGNTGFESITVTSSGSANSVGTFTAQDVQTLTIKGDKDLSLGTTAPTTGGQGVEATRYGAGLANVSGSLTSVDASTLTGNLSLTIGTEIDGALDNTSGLAVRETITGGSGSDTFRLAPGANIGGSTTNTDVLIGGGGTDTVVVLGGSSNISAATTPNVRSIEALQIRTGHDDVAGNDTEVADSVAIDADAFDSLATIYVRNEGQQMTNSSVASGAIAEQQQLVLTGTATATIAVGGATPFAFLGVEVATTIADTASAVATAIIARKTAILAGTTATAAGLTDITASGAVLTLTYGGAGGTGDVGNLSAAAAINGITANASAELRKGVASVQSTTTTGTNEANNVWTSAVEAATVTLADLTAAQATAVTIAHGTTGNNGITGNNLNVNLKVSTGAADSAGVTIVDGVNADPRFNFILSTTNTAYATAVTNATENLTITDSDTESNTVALKDVVQHAGTVTLNGGAAGNFLNLDTTTAGANGGLMQYGVNGTSSDVTYTVADNTATSGQVKISALTIAAGTFAGNIVARVTNPTATASATGAQSITLGTGNDILILDNVSNLTAGLGITDTMAGGTGTDTLVVDGENAGGIALSASEFTNVTGFETFRFIGNTRAADNGRTATNSYSLSLNDAAVTQNAAANILNIVNDNGIANATGAVTANGGITIDVRPLSSSRNINYDGQETDTGATLTVSATTADVTAASALANASTMTADRFIFADANINATAVIDGGADRTTVGNGVTGTGSDIGHARNADVLEVRNASVVSLGDLAGIRNVSSIEFTNDTAVVQTSVLQLADATVDALVNSTLATVSTDTTTIGNSFEVLYVTGVDSANVTGAFSQLNLDGSLIVNAANIISVTGGGGSDTIIGGAGADTIVGAGGADAITSGLGADSITAGAGDDVITLTADGAAIDTLVFSGATLLLNGADTITGFTLAADVLKFSSLTSGSLTGTITAGTMATATALATEATTIALANNKLFVAQVALVAGIDTAAEVITAIANAGVLDALDVDASATAFLILSGADSATTAFVYGIVNDATAAIATGELVLIGTITTNSNVFTAANFSF